jgi:hypothetical protein
VDDVELRTRIGVANLSQLFAADAVFKTNAEELIGPEAIRDFI